MPKVFVSGGFDVENYGDCLFPVVAARRLEALGFSAAPASPTAVATRWTDSPPPEAIFDIAEAGADFAGVLIGGGNVISNRPVSLPAYVAAGVGETAYPALWLGMTLAAARRGCPVIWNAPGVSHPFSPAERGDLIPSVLAAAGYVAVRDEVSREYLGPAAANATVAPDTAVEISRCWPRQSLAPVFRDMLARKAAPAASGFAAIHVKDRAVQGDAAAMAQTIDAFAGTTGLTPVLLALAPCHGDDAVARAVSGAMRRPHVALDDAATLREIAAAIAFSEVYVGASLHGYITSYSYGRPGVIVARPALPKFAGFLSHAGRQDDLVSDWQTAFARAAARPPERTWAAGLGDAVDAHWARVGAALNDSAAAARGEAYLRRWGGLGGMAQVLAAQTAKPAPVTARRRLGRLARGLAASVGLRR